MTKAETARLLAIMTAAWPRFEVDDVKVQIWHDMLTDVPYEIAVMALKKLIAENIHPPSIAEMRRAVFEVTTPPQERLDAASAWGEGVRAVELYGWPQPQAALASLSPRTRRVAEMIGWQEICSGNPDVVRAQFMRMYETVQQREMHDLLLPQPLRQQLDAVWRKALRAKDGGDELCQAQAQ